VLNARLKPIPEMVSGPWGRIQIEGAHGDALVMLNGTTPEYFVGHVDEANHDIGAKQMIVSPVGTQNLHILDSKTFKPVWSGPIEVKENQRLILYVNRGSNGQIVYKDWKDGARIASLKRFEAGTATATIAVAPLVTKFTADRNEIKCGEPVHLAWTTKDGVKTTVLADNQVLADSLNGDLAVQPTRTTTYQFRSVGPGGTVTNDQTIKVTNEVTTSLVPSANEIRFVKVGDKIMEQGTAKLNWTASNADAIHLEPVGLLTGNSGEETITAMPANQAVGPVDELRTYKLTATNACGGTHSSVATVHVVGSIEPEQVAEEKPPELPQTGSPLPLIALFGALSLGSGLILRWFARA
jgi:LPXTG-motif cell wall-anchored protein